MGFFLCPLTMEALYCRPQVCWKRPISFVIASGRAPSQPVRAACPPENKPTSIYYYFFAVWQAKQHGTRGRSASERANYCIDKSTLNPKEEK